jgi:peptide/nickel transport system permease protein
MIGTSVDVAGATRTFWTRRRIIWWVVLLILLALFLWAPTPYDPNAQLSSGLSLDGLPLSPSWAHPFGTDTLGRDELSRAIVGGRLSLTIGFIGSLVATSIGTTIGLASGYLQGWIGSVLMRFTDVMMAFPYLLLAAALQAVLGPGIGNLLIVIGAVTWVNAARVVNGLTLSETRREYVSSLAALGVPRRRILVRHILPNISTPVVILFTTGISYTILLEATLSFLGLGVEPPTATWGNMIREGQSYFQSAPWLVLAPGLLLIATVTVLSLVSDRATDKSFRLMKSSQRIRNQDRKLEL